MSFSSIDLNLIESLSCNMGSGYIKTTMVKKDQMHNFLYTRIVIFCAKTKILSYFFIKSYFKVSPQGRKYLSINILENVKHKESLCRFCRFDEITFYKENYSLQNTIEIFRDIFDCPLDLFYIGKIAAIGYSGLNKSFFNDFGLHYISISDE